MLDTLLLGEKKVTKGMTTSSDGVWDLLPVTSIPSAVLFSAEQFFVCVAETNGIPYSSYDLDRLFYESVVINGYRGDEENILIPDEIDGKIVVGLTAYALYKDCLECKGRDEDGIWNGEYWYERVPSVKISSVTLPSRVFYLDDFVFADISTLSHVSLPPMLRHIGYGCFKQSGIKKIEFPQFIFEVPDSCFCECFNLASIKFKNDIHTIGDRAFDGCLSLKEINLPQTTTEIKTNAFSRTGLTHIKLPSGLEKIKAHAFANCFSLEYCYMPRDISQIDDNAFSWYVEKMNSAGLHRYENVHNPTTTLFVYPGSYAHMWAVQHGHKVASAEL